MIPQRVRKVFGENLWFIATCGDGPHVVPVGFKCVMDDGRLAIGAILLEETLENIRRDGRVAIAAADPLTAEAYQIRGTAALATDGPAYAHYAALAEDTYRGERPLKCALVVTPERLIDLGPNAHNREELPLDEEEIYGHQSGKIQERRLLHPALRLRRRGGHGQI